MGWTARLALAAGMLAITAPAALSQSLLDGSAPHSWTGVYVGGQAALLATKSLEWNAPGLTGPTLLGDMGGGAGVFGGADYQFNDYLVAGVLGEVNYDSTTLLFNGSTYGFYKWNAAIKARLGLAVAPNVLAYGSLGWDWGHFDYTPAYPGSANAEFTDSGLQYGIGVDAMLTSNIMGRIEATYSHYGHNQTTPTVESAPSIIAVKAGIAFRFD